MTVLDIAGADLEVNRYGSTSGPAVILYHGLAGSATLPPLWRDMVDELGIDLIAVARPGYGRSAPREMANIGSWAPIVTELFDNLGISRAGVLGISAGAPYSYGLACLIPERISRVAIAGGLGLVNERETRAAYPETSGTLFEWFGNADFDEVAEFWAKNFAAGLADLPDDHRWRQVIADSLAHNGAGPGREAILQQRTWGFDVEKITVPVELWHTAADTEVPFTTAQIVAERIPGAILHESTDPAHIPSEETLRVALAAAAG